MEYERIHKGQTGIISPSKLRMKFIGPHNGKKKEGNSSARTSPARQEDIDLVKNGLLTSNEGDEDDEASPNGHFLSHPNQADQSKNSKKENGNSSAIHPIRTVEDENLDYDSNTSSSSFEFHNERVAQSQMTRSLSRPMSSKWNDAEKWIMSKPNSQQNYSKKSSVNCQNHRVPGPNAVRGISDSANSDYKSSIVKASSDYTHLGLEKFSFDKSGFVETQCEDFLGDRRETPEDGTGLLMVRSVCMRDMGTEMTPMTSLEPSRSTTPVGATTPLRSPTSSIPTTPRGGAPPLPLQNGSGCLNVAANCRKELSEEELKQKTRREIVALGVRLGKLNIAAWASKDEDENHPSPVTASPNLHEAERIESERIECEKRAAVWEEAEKSKYAARYKREEIKIHAWESQQKDKLEAELRKIEAQVEQLHAQAQSKMVKKISMAKQKAEEKRAAAEARKSRDAEKTAVQAEYIRQTGKIPPFNYSFCCGLWW